jgi:hypothetical protein
VAGNPVEPACIAAGVRCSADEAPQRAGASQQLDQARHPQLTPTLRVGVTPRRSASDPAGGETGSDRDAQAGIAPRTRSVHKTLPRGAWERATAAERGRRAKVALAHRSWARKLDQLDIETQCLAGRRRGRGWPSDPGIT